MPKTNEAFRIELPEMDTSAEDKLKEPDNIRLKDKAKMRPHALSTESTASSVMTEASFGTKDTFEATQSISHKSVTTLPDGRRVVGNTRKFMDSLVPNRFNFCRFAKHFFYEFLGVFSMPIVFLVENRDFALLAGNLGLNNVLRSRFFPGRYTRSCTQRCAFVSWIDIANGFLFWPIIFALVLTRRNLPDTFSVYIVYCEVTIMCYAFITRCVAIAAKYGYRSDAEYNAVRENAFKNERMWRSWLIFRSSAWTVPEVIERLIYTLACAGKTAENFDFRCEFDTHEEALNAREDIHHFLLPSLLPELKQQINETSDEHGIDLKITIQKENAWVSNKIPKRKTKHVVVVPAILVGTSIAMQELIVGSPLEPVQKFTTWAVFVTLLVPFAVPFVSNTPFLRNAVTQQRIIEGDCPYYFDSTNSSTSQSSQVNAFEICGFRINAQKYNPTVKCDLPSNFTFNSEMHQFKCCEIQRVSEMYESAMHWLVGEVIIHNGLPEPENKTLLRPSICNSSRLTDCTEEWRIQMACLAPSPNYWYFIMALRMLILSVNIPLLLLSSEYILAGSKSYLRVLHMLRHLDSMITPSVFVKNIVSDEMVIRNVGDVPTLARDKTHKETKTVTNRKDELQSGLQDSIKPRSKSIHTQDNIQIFRIPPLIPFRSPKNIRNFFYLRNSIRYLYSSFHIRTECLLGYAMAACLLFIFALVLVLGGGLPVLLGSAIYSYYIPYDFVILITSLIVLIIILILTGAYGLYKGNIQTNITNRALIFLKNEISDNEDIDSIIARNTIESMRELFMYNMSLRPFKLFGVTMDMTGLGGLQSIGSAIVALLGALLSMQSEQKM